MPRTADSASTTRRTATRSPARPARVATRLQRPATRANTPARAVSSLRIVPAPAKLGPAARALPAASAGGSPVTYSKEDLLKRFAPLVRHVVERVAATLPRIVDHEDL